MFQQVRGTDRCVDADLEVLQIKISIMLIKWNWKKTLEYWNLLEVLEVLKVLRVLKVLKVLKSFKSFRKF